MADWQVGKRSIYLASQSPRRAELLRQLGVHFEVVPASADETRQAGEAPATYIERVVNAKIAAALARSGGRNITPLLAADTVVELDGDVLGKPGSREDAVHMLMRLSGREHRVLSSVALHTGGETSRRLSVSQVRFRTITPGEAAVYWETGEPVDKAGGYAIQGYGAVFVERLAGSYSGVMGLPLFETAQLLRSVGVDVLSGEYKA